MSRFEREFSMNKNYVSELPEGYSPVMTVDANDKKTMIMLNIAAALITIIGIILCFYIYSSGVFIIWHWLMLFVVYIVYIVLHELTHGAAYKILTGRKLTFGISATAAFCGVPDIYVSRKTALISVLAPFTVYSIVFILGACLITDPEISFYSAFMFALHLGGCSGDLYDALLLMTKLNDPTILMHDDGLKQTFYKKTN